MQIKTENIAIIISALIFAAVFMSIPLQHDHPGHLPGNDDCPAKVLEVTLLSASLALLIIFNIIRALDFEQIPLANQLLPQTSLYLTHSNKAPPLFPSN